MAYASKYYDPVKAHEYYMKHRKLKGKRSIKGMTQAQKEQWAYAKNELTLEERQEKKNASNASMASRTQKRDAVTADAKLKKESISNISKAQKEAIVKAAKAEREKFAKECSSKVKAIRERLKNMSKEEREDMKKKCFLMIELLSKIYDVNGFDKVYSGENSKEINDILDYLIAAHSALKNNVFYEYNDTYLTSSLQEAIKFSKNAYHFGEIGTIAWKLYEGLSIINYELPPLNQEQQEALDSIIGFADHDPEPVIFLSSWLILLLLHVSVVLISLSLISGTMNSSVDLRASVFQVLPTHCQRHHPVHTGKHQPRVYSGSDNLNKL